MRMGVYQVADMIVNGGVDRQNIQMLAPTWRDLYQQKLEFMLRQRDAGEECIAIRGKEVPMTHLPSPHGGAGEQNKDSKGEGGGPGKGGPGAGKGRAKGGGTQQGGTEGPEGRGQGSRAGYGGRARHSLHCILHHCP